MSGRTDVTLSRALLALRNSLSGVAPSSELDARFQRSVEAWNARRTTAVAFRPIASRRALPLLIAAGTIAAIVGFGWWVAREREIGHESAHSVSARGGESPDAAVMRVRATLGAWVPNQAEYWVDIGVTGDGTLRVERVTPVDERFVP